MSEEKKGGLAALIVEKMAPKPMVEEDEGAEAFAEEEMGEEPKALAAQDMMTAIQNNDPKLFAEALEDFMALIG